MVMLKQVRFGLLQVDQLAGIAEFCVPSFSFHHDLYGIGLGVMS